MNKRQPNQPRSGITPNSYLDNPSSFLYTQLMNRQDIRTFGILAHVNAGKTTTTERLLYLTNAIKYTGNVDEGTTTTDFMYEERERGITIQSACVQCNWDNTTFQLIDTPGHIDFTIEVERSLHVLDSTIIVLCGQSGFQAQTENVYRLVKSSDKPIIFYINKLDKESANFERVLEEVNLREKTVVLSTPYYEKDKLLGVIDVLTGEFEFIEGDNRELPDDIKIIAEYYKTEMLDTLCEFDDNLIEIILDNPPTQEQLIASIRKLTINRTIVPVLAGASKINLGIKNIANAIKEFLPSASEIKDKYFSNSKEIIENIPEKVAYCFKNIFNSDIGELAYIKIKKGCLRVNDTLQTSHGEVQYAVKELYLPFADIFEPIQNVEEGDICLVKFESIQENGQEIRTGDTLFSSSYSGKISLEHFNPPRPVIFAKINFNNIEEQDKFREIKNHLLLEDPSLSFTENLKTGQMLIGGMGELHLEIFRERLKNSYNINLIFGKPNIILKKQVRENSQKRIVTKIGYDNTEVEFRATLSICQSKKKAIINNTKYPKIEQIIDSQLEAIDEYEIINSTIEISNLEFATQSLPEGIIYLAVVRLFRDWLPQLKWIEVEPIMVLEILTTPEYTGNVTADILSKKGEIKDISRIDQFDKVIAKLPMRTLFGYATNLRSITAGHSSFSIQLSDYKEIEL